MALYMAHKVAISLDGKKTVAAGKYPYVVGICLLYVALLTSLDAGVHL